MGTCPKMRLNTKIWACLGLIVVHIDLRQAKLSDQRLCADPNCSVLVGVGRTVLKYFAKDEGMLNFANNKPVKIFSKGAGSNPNLWGVMIDGRRGYVNKAHIQEQRVYRKDLEFTVPTEFSKESKDQENNQEKQKETEQIPLEANIEKTEKLDGEQVKTEQPSLNLAEQVKPSEVVSGAHV